MAALAVVDEHPPLTQAQILETKTEHLATTQPAQHHRLHHGPVPLGAQRRHQRGDLVGFEDPRQPAHRAHQRLTPSVTSMPTRRQAPGHRVDVDTGIAAGDQIAIERRHRRQPTPDRRRRQPRAAIRDPHHVLGAHPSPALRGHEAEHIRGAHLHRVLGDDREERLQIVRVGPHRVRPRSTSSELQELVDQPMTDDIHLSAVTIASDAANLRRPDHGKPPCPSSARRKAPRAVSPGGGSPV